jgi:polyribonucleotide nucleotidyltransferase
MIEEIANPRLPEVGERFDGTVVKTTTFGAFVNLTPARDGLVHISKLGRGKRLSSVEEAVNVGDKLLVEVQEIDPQGKVSLKPVGEGWDPPEGGWPRQEGDGDRGDRPPRDRDRRPRDRDRGGREGGFRQRREGGGGGGGGGGS